MGSGQRVHLASNIDCGILLFISQRSDIENVPLSYPNGMRIIRQSSLLYCVQVTLSMLFEGVYSRIPFLPSFFSTFWLLPLLLLSVLFSPFLPASFTIFSRIVCRKVCMGSGPYLCVCHTTATQNIKRKREKRREGQRPQGRIGARKRACLDFVLTVNKQTMKQIHERAPGKKRKEEEKRKRETTTTRARVGYCFASSNGRHGLFFFVRQYACEQ